MRRSVREALVGFSLLAGLAGGLGFWAWLRGVSLARDTWAIEARFADAAGLAERSPVTFRGVLVGNVRRVKVREDAVVAELEITDPDLRIARPVVARIGASSLLGGDATVALLSAGKPLPGGAPGPRERGCDPLRMVCNGGRVSGVAAPTIDSVTETVQNLLDEAERSKLIAKMEAATVTFERTARETEKLSRDAQVFLKDGRTLVGSLNQVVGRTDPILTNVTAATRNIEVASADAAKASRSARNITAALDNPRSLADLQATLANARRLTDQWEAVGGDVRKLTGDPKFIDGIRSVSVGLGRFFEELYPAQTDAARAKEQREQARQRQERQRLQELDDRLAPRSKAPALSPR
ncbi:MAG: MlaD family protein [Synechococcaceae cyanobacterium]|nr:MlaD family protein [Synechococcaceae cyanobacterium]